MPDPTPDLPTPAPATRDLAGLLAQLQDLAPELATLRTDLGEAAANVVELVPLVGHQDAIGIIRAAVGDAAEIRRHVTDLVAALGKIKAAVAASRGQ